MTISVTDFLNTVKLLHNNINTVIEHESPASIELIKRLYNEYFLANGVLKDGAEAMIDNLIQQGKLSKEMAKILKLGVAKKKLEKFHEAVKQLENMRSRPSTKEGFAVIQAILTRFATVINDCPSSEERAARAELVAEDLRLARAQLEAQNTFNALVEHAKTHDAELKEITDSLPLGQLTQYLVAQEKIASNEQYLQKLKQTALALGQFLDQLGRMSLSHDQILAKVIELNLFGKHDADKLVNLIQQQSDSKVLSKDLINLIKQTAKAGITSINQLTQKHEAMLITAKNALQQYLASMHKQLQLPEVAPQAFDYVLAVNRTKNHGAELGQIKERLEAFLRQSHDQVDQADLADQLTQLVIADEKITNSSGWQNDLQELQRTTIALQQFLHQLNNSELSHDQILLKVIDLNIFSKNKVAADKFFSLIKQKSTANMAIVDLIKQEIKASIASIHDVMHNHEAVLTTTKNALQQHLASMRKQLQLPEAAGTAMLQHAVNTIKQLPADSEKRRQEITAVVVELRQGVTGLWGQKFANEVTQADERNEVAEQTINNLKDQLAAYMARWRASKNDKHDDNNENERITMMFMQAIQDGANITTQYQQHLDEQQKLLQSGIDNFKLFLAEVQQPVTAKRSISDNQLVSKAIALGLFNYTDNDDARKFIEMIKQQPVPSRASLVALIEQKIQQLIPDFEHLLELNQNTKRKNNVLLQQAMIELSSIEAEGKQYYDCLSDQLTEISKYRKTFKFFFKNMFTLGGHSKKVVSRQSDIIRKLGVAKSMVNKVAEEKHKVSLVLPADKAPHRTALEIQRALREKLVAVEQAVAKLNRIPPTHLLGRIDIDKFINNNFKQVSSVIPLGKLLEYRAKDGKYGWIWEVVGKATTADDKHDMNKTTTSGVQYLSNAELLQLLDSCDQHYPVVLAQAYSGMHKDERKTATINYCLMALLRYIEEHWSGQVTEQDCSEKQMRAKLEQKINMFGGEVHSQETKDMIDCSIAYIKRVVESKHGDVKQIKDQLEREIAWHHNLREAQQELFAEQTKAITDWTRGLGSLHELIDSMCRNGIKIGDVEDIGEAEYYRLHDANRDKTANIEHLQDSKKLLLDLAHDLPAEKLKHQHNWDLTQEEVMREAEIREDFGLD